MKTTNILLILLLLLCIEGYSQELVQRGELEVVPFSGAVRNDANNNPGAVIDVVASNIDDLVFEGSLILDKEKIQNVKWRLYVYVPRGISENKILIYKPGYLPFHLKFQPGELMPKKLYRLELECKGDNTVTPQDFTGYVPYAVLKDSTLTFYYGKNKPKGAYDVEKMEKGKYSNIKEWTPKCEQVKTVVFDQSFKNYRPRSCERWFYDCKNLTSIKGIKENLNTSEVTDMQYMFWCCKKLKSLDVSGFNTAKVTNMKDMFSSCESLTSLDVRGFNTAKVTNMEFMFFRCESLTSLDVRGFNTANVTDMERMFCGCSNLTSLDVRGFNTANVTDMYGMFDRCSNLTSLDVRGFNTANVTDMVAMFDDCSNLTSLDVSGFNTAQVISMRLMFYGCKSLTYLDVSSFNTDRVKDMSSMFEGCEKLTSLDVSGFNTAKVSDMRYMFYKCSNLKTIYVGVGWNTNIVIANQMEKLEEIDTHIAHMKNANDDEKKMLQRERDHLESKIVNWRLFNGCTNLVGGRGTKYDPSADDKTRARIDGGPSNPGYFTLKR